MNALDFLRLPHVRHSLERAAHAAGTGLSIHAVQAGEEGVCVFSCEARTACRFVAGVSHGMAACRRSRGAAAADALRRNETTPFICHMGLACLSAPLLEPELALVITLGPYCPSEGREALEPDVRHGLQMLESQERGRLPFELRDIPIVPATAAPAALAWLLETLRACWRAEDIPEEQPDVSGLAGDVRAAGRPRIRKESALVPYQAGTIAAALAGGMQGKARELAMAVLSEEDGPPRRRLAVQRARTVALAAAVLETAEKAGLACEPAWGHFPVFLTESRQAVGVAGLLDAVMDLLGKVRRATVRDVARAPEYAGLNRLIMEHLAKGITLNEVAAVLGVQPSAITHRLQRKFGMSFSEYAGRLRVDKAKELLRRTQLPVSDVGMRVGVADTSNFGKLFRKFEHMTPAQYREQFRNEK